MDALPTYHDLNEKRLIFDETTVDDLDDLNELLEQLRYNSDRRFIFRGTNEAKYKLFNSGQRYWSALNGNEKLGITYQAFVEKLILNAQTFHDGLLKKFFNSFGQKTYSNDLPTLSFLQHYGAPTPFLDWTYNVYTALFFSIDNCKISTQASSGITQYFSLYYIEINTNVKGEKAIPNLLSIIRNNAIIAEIANEVNDLLDNYGIELTKKIQRLEYSFLNEAELLLIPGYTDDGVKFSINNAPDFHLFYNQQNFNVISQEGLFLFNANELHPLEFYFQNKPVTTGRDFKFNLPKIQCINIHKSLIEEVKTLLNQLPFPKNKEYIYPTGEFIAKNAVNQIQTLHRN